ncbi:MAG TPA: hypothetical protein GXX72_06495 [Clostridiaceae bacterium]|nr:hypothetical protein [Clostridiaceae bacterium]
MPENIKYFANKTLSRVLSKHILCFILCLLLVLGGCSEVADSEVESSAITVSQSSLQGSDKLSGLTRKNIQETERSQSTTIEETNSVGFLPNHSTTISLQLLEDEINLDPFVVKNGFPVDSASGSDLVYETLIKWDPEKLTYVPGLAELVNISTNGIELRLRQDAKWHDGRAVTLDQIEMSLYWMCKFNQSCNKAEGLITKAVTLASDDVEQQNILLALAEPDEHDVALALDLLCRAPIVPTTDWSEGEDPLTISREKLRDAANRNPLGTGRWKVLLDDDFQLVLEKQSGEFINKPQFLMLRKYKNTTMRERAFNNNEIDILVGTLSDKDKQVVYYPGRPMLAGIVVNKDNSLLQNPYIRNLLQLAVNTAKTGKVLDNKAPATIFWHYFGGATLVNSLRASLSNPQYSTMYQQNKNEIAVLLEGDFSADGLLRLKGKKVADLNLIFPEEPNIEAACQSYAQLARQQGLRLNLIALNEDEYTERLNKGEYDLCYVCAADRLDTPYSLAQEFLSHIGGGEIENLSPEKPDNEGQTLALDLAASINTDQFTKAARACFQYSLTKMYYYPLGYGTINNVYLKSDYWDNIFDYWTLSLDNRDLTGIGASDILDSISTKAKD